MNFARLSRFILYLPCASVFTQLNPSLTMTPATPFPSLSLKVPEILKSIFFTGFFFSVSAGCGLRWRTGGFFTRFCICFLG
ncbi:Uncharacterised protein [Segatella copri]|nr:Uncharacterised protein [Segatella copri]